MCRCLPHAVLCRPAAASQTREARRACERRASLPALAGRARAVIERTVNWHDGVRPDRDLLFLRCAPRQIKQWFRAARHYFAPAAETQALNCSRLQKPHAARFRHSRSAAARLLAGSMDRYRYLGITPFTKSLV